MNIEYKIGDFIRHKVLGTANKCTSINDGEFENKVSTSPSLSFDSCYMLEYELWQVRPGEWVWHKLLNELVQYKGPDADDPTQHWFYCPDFSNPAYSITTCSILDCEPFLGKLPSYIKDN